MPTSIEVYHQGEQWHVREQGEDEPRSSHDTKEEAQAEGRRVAVADGAELFIKGLDGTIGEKDSHGSDPRNVPG